MSREKNYKKLSQFTTELIELYTLNQQELSQMITQRVSKKGYTTHQLKGGLICIPDTDSTPVTLIAHLDTINTHKEGGKDPHESHIQIINQTLQLTPLAPPEVKCLGADDRNGVHLLLKVVESPKFKPILIFPYDEEIGCVGSNSMIRELQHTQPDYLNQLFYSKALIQIDRGVHGYKHVWEQEVVYYEETNLAFTQLMNQYFIEDLGSFTDVVEWCEYLGVAGCNIGAAYKNEHTRYEQTHLPTLKQNFKKLNQLLTLFQQEETPQYFHEAEPMYYVGEILDEYNYYVEMSDEELVEEMTYDYQWREDREVLLTDEEKQNLADELEVYRWYVENYL